MTETAAEILELVAYTKIFRDAIGIQYDFSLLKNNELILNSTVRVFHFLEELSRL